MKKLIVLTSLFALSLNLTAGEGWLTNIDKAKEEAKKEGKSVRGELTGSEWCQP